MMTISIFKGNVIKWLHVTLQTIQDLRREDPVLLPEEAQVTDPVRVIVTHPHPVHLAEIMMRTVHQESLYA
jgi:hypothetical protein